MNNRGQGFLIQEIRKRSAGPRRCAKNKLFYSAWQSWDAPPSESSPANRPRDRVLKKSGFVKVGKAREEFTAEAQRKRRRIHRRGTEEEEKNSPQRRRGRREEFFWV
jgi:hypothetical protein